MADGRSTVGRRSIAWERVAPGRGGGRLVDGKTLARMGEVSVEDYYSLCGRLDTLEHVHEVLVAVAAQMMGNAVDDEDVPDPVRDEPSGAVN